MKRLNRSKKGSFAVLSLKQEAGLSDLEKIEYYKRLRAFLLQTRHQMLSPGSLSICPLLNSFVLPKLLALLRGYPAVVDGFDPTGLVAIYAHTHQSRDDHIQFITSNPNHTVLLNSAVLSVFYKLLLDLNGVVYVDKRDKKSKNAAKLEMMRLLLHGKSITVFPESAWNCSPNKLHLPLYLGIADMARKTGCPIVPVVHEYSYDHSRHDGTERITGVHTRYGTPIYAAPTDDPFGTLEEVSRQFSTMRWELLEQKGVVPREEAKIEDYVDFIKGNTVNLKKAGISIDVERQCLLGASEDFYRWHDINDVEYDENARQVPPWRRAHQTACKTLKRK